MKIGVRLEALELPVRRGLEEAERLGVGGVQFDAVNERAPQALSQTGRRELRQLLAAHSLELTVLGCPLRRGLGDPTNLDARIEHVRNVLSLSYELGARKVVVQAGKVPEDPENAAQLTEALAALGSFGDRTGTTLALETGLEDGAALRRFLDRFDTGGLAANYDPANLLLNGFDPYASALALRERIVHAHARDARVSGASRTAQEVPLGHGDLDWMRLADTLREIDYQGWVVVERESGTNRRADVAQGVAFLRRFVF